MNIGKVGWSDGSEEEAGGVEVNGVNGDVACYRCGGWGHISRECPTQKGKGKGKGGGKDGIGEKGRNKGKGKGKGQEMKVRGKGYQGTCWKCGKAGHKGWECGTRNIGVVDKKEHGGYEGEEEEHYSLGHGNIGRGRRARDGGCCLEH